MACSPRPRSRLAGFKLNVLASYANQSDYGANPVSYSADYFNLELGAAVAGFSLSAGYEELGSDGGAAAFQTPLATLHAFNGWADMFLTTPATGLRDYYVKLGKSLKVPALPGLNAAVVYHEFDSDFGGAELRHRVGRLARLQARPDRRCWRSMRTSTPMGSPPTPRSSGSKPTTTSDQGGIRNVLSCTK